MTTTTSPTLREYNGLNIPVAGTYDVDPAHTTIEFVARHMMISKVRGHFTGFKGVIEVAEDPEQSSVEVTIDATSLTTGDDKRDGHLRTADFFDIENHREITFRSTSVHQGASGEWTIDGDLTVRGVTRPLSLQVEFEGASVAPWGDERIGFSASAEVNREDWGLVWNAALETGGVLVSPKVRLELDVQAVRRAASPAVAA